MKIKIYIFATFAFVSVVCSGGAYNPLSDEFINEINNKQSFWRAGRNFDPDTLLSEVRKLLGLNKKYANIPVKKNYQKIKADNIPETFDARVEWSSCNSIKTIADQSACGSCWAVSTASAISDRICIATNGSSQPQISAANIMNCCIACGDGCNGGYPIGAWWYWVNTGIVTGGAYNTTDGCQNYPFPSCEHHTTGSEPNCTGTYNTPKCSQECDADTSYNYEDSLSFGSDYYIIGPAIEQMQTDIMTNGPVTAEFMVFADFLSYKSGVYVQTTWQALGGHAVRIIGWGVDNGVDYWLVTNSWNSDWGDSGTFKIRRGTDECGIEDDIIGGTPKL